MTDMNEATAHGVRELKALLSAALIIAQARERTREHELRQQEREMAERERQARRGAHHDPAASPTGPDPNSLLTQPDPARQERELESIRASAARTSNVTAERDDEYAAAASAAQSTQTPAAQLDLAEKWANAHADPDTGPLYRAELDNQVRARGVDPAKILLTPREGQQPSGQSFTPTIIDPEQVRQDADIRAGELERDPDARRAGSRNHPGASPRRGRSPPRRRRGNTGGRAPQRCLARRWASGAAGGQGIQHRSLIGDPRPPGDQPKTAHHQPGPSPHPEQGTLNQNHHRGCAEPPPFPRWGLSASSGLG